MTVIDRTVVCSAGLYGGLPKLHIVASSEIRNGPQAHTPEISVVPTAGRRDPIGSRGSAAATSISARSASDRAAQVPLTSRGLSGFVASQFEDDLGCLTPARVLIHVHAVFPGRASLRLGAPVPNSPRVWYVIAPVDKGEIAVRTMKGKPDRVRELLVEDRQGEALHPRELRLSAPVSCRRPKSRASSCHSAPSVVNAIGLPVFSLRTATCCTWRRSRRRRRTAPRRAAMRRATPSCRPHVDEYAPAHLAVDHLPPEDRRRREAPTPTGGRPRR